MSDPVVTVQPEVITVVVNNDTDPVVVTLGSEAITSVALGYSSASAASAASAAESVTNLTTIASSPLAGDAVIFTDRSTGTMYRLALIDGELLKEELDPLDYVNGVRGSWGVLTGL